MGNIVTGMILKLILALLVGFEILEYVTGEISKNLEGVEYNSSGTKILLQWPTNANSNDIKNSQYDLKEKENRRLSGSNGSNNHVQISNDNTMHHSTFQVGMRNRESENILSADIGPQSTEQLHRTRTYFSFGEREKDETFDYHLFTKLRSLQETSLDVNIVINSTLVMMQVNDRTVLEIVSTVHKNERKDSFHHDGVTVVVLNHEGRHKVTQRFSTFYPGQVDVMFRFLGSIQAGTVVFFLAVPEWTLMLNEEVRSELGKFGFLFGGKKTCYAETWVGAAVVELASLGTMKHLTAQEEASTAGRALGRAVFETIVTTVEMAKPVAFHFYLPKHKVRESLCSWHNDKKMERQRIFCDKYDGYGDLCKCHEPISTRTRENQPVIHIKESIPVAVVTANSPTRLFRTLQSLFLASGSSQTNILLVIDGIHEETVELAEVLHVPFVIHKPQGRPGSNIRPNTNVRFALESALDVYSQSDKVVILEDDLIVSPDILRYFQETSVLLDDDSSILSVNAFSYNSISGVAANVSALRRVEAYPYYGWMIKRSMAIYLLSFWMNEERGDWDKWILRHESNSHDVIIPEVSRVYHEGSQGVHVSGFFQSTFYKRIITNQNRSAQLQDLELLRKSSYEAFIGEEIHRAEVISFNILENEEILPNGRPGPFVMFVQASTFSDDELSFTTVMMSLRTYYLDTLEMFRGVMKFNIKGRYLYVVGCPVSTLYCTPGLQLLKPSVEYYRAVDDRMTEMEVSWLKAYSQKRIRTTIFLREATLENYVNSKNDSYVAGDLSPYGAVFTVE